MLLLDKLWEGRLVPAEQQYRPVSDFSPFLRKQEACERLMKAELSEEGKRALEEYLQAEGSIDIMGNSDSFAAGFRMGALVMLDVLLGNPPFNISSL